MVCNEIATDLAPPSLSDALLFTTVCIAGRPVEIQVKDGSFYSGIFHTARADKNYGIVLKKARKIGRDKGDTDLAVGLGGVIETLFVLSDDLVQVIVKDFILPAEGIVSNHAGDGVKDAPGLVKIQDGDEDSERELKSSASRNLGENGGEAYLYMPNKKRDTQILAGSDDGKVLEDFLEKVQDHEDGNQDIIYPQKVEEQSQVLSHLVNERQVREDIAQGEKGSDHHTEKVLHDVHCLTPSYASLPGMITVDETQLDILSKNTNGASYGSHAALPARPEASDSKLPTSTNLISSDANSSSVSTSSTYFSVSDNKPSPFSMQSTPANPSSPRENSVSNISAKGFKLNPGAKVFVPSFANYRSAAAAPSTIANMDYASNIPAMIPTGAARPSLEVNSFASRSSLPFKPFQCSNLVAGHSGVSPQYSRPIVGLPSIRQQPVRLSGQFQPVQEGPAYVHPNSHAVMVGRLGQLMYIHPVSQDAIQATSFLSQGSPHSLLSPYQANVPKFQGTQFVGSKDIEGGWWRI